jgi:hypothetical protein
MSNSVVVISCNTLKNIKQAKEGIQFQLLLLWHAAISQNVPGKTLFVAKSMTF